MAALTRSDARKASEIVMLIFRALHCSRFGDAVRSHCWISDEFI